MSAPLAVNTADGTVWRRRAATRGGEALYAPVGVCSCPEFVMATLAELAEHGIAGSAEVLPVPAGSVQAEIDRLEARIAELKEGKAALTAQGQVLRENAVAKPLPSGDVRCGCGHPGIEHHHAGAKCWARLPREVGQPVRLCPCEEFRPVSADESAARLGRYMAPEGEHYAVVHHDYRVGHDLPELGGAR